MSDLVRRNLINLFWRDNG